jgi:phage-related protein
MAELGRAYIEVRADLAKFPPELRAKLEAALKEGLAGTSFNELEEQGKKAGAKAGEETGKAFSKSAKKKIEDEGKSGGGILKWFSAVGDVFEKNKKKKGGLFDSISSLFSEATETGVKAISEKAGQLAGVAGQLGGALSGAGGMVGSLLQFAAIAVLAPIIVGLAGALVQLAGALFALPAVAGVAAAAIAPLIIGFQGFGEAVGAGLSGDTEKFNEALKGLPPSMRAVVKEFVALGPVLKSIKATVQEALFKPLIGAIKPLATTLLPMLRNGLGLVAGSLGRMLAGFAELLASNDIVHDFAQVFQTTARIIDRMAPALTDLFGVLIGVMEKGLPFVERFFGSITDGINSAVAWLSKIQQNGQLNEWLEKAAKTGASLWRVLKLAAQYLLKMVSSFGDEGTSFLDDLADKIQDLIKWLNTPEGAKYLENLGVVVAAAGKVLTWFIGVAASVLPAISWIIGDLRKVDDTVAAIGHAFASFGRWVWSGLTAAWDAIKAVGGAIADFFTETIPNAISAAVDWIVALPGNIVDALGSFREAGKSFLLDMLKSWYEQVFEWVGNVIGIIWSLPQLIPAAFEVLKQNVHDEIQALWDGAVALFWWGVNTTVAIFNAIPGLLADAGNAIWGFITDLWQRVVVDSYNSVVSGFNHVVDFFSSLPDKVRALGPRLYQAAVDLGHRIGDGLSNIGNFASDIGHKIVNTIKSGINWVIDSINRGIGEIDDQLPGSLPRIPHLAKGAVVDSPTLALIGEAGREVVMPLNDPVRARQLAEESNLFEVLGRGGQQAPVINLTAVLDGFGVLRVVDMRINDALDAQGAELANGART